MSPGPSRSASECSLRLDTDPNLHCGRPQRRGTEGLKCLKEHNGLGGDVQRANRINTSWHSMRSAIRVQQGRVPCTRTCARRGYPPTWKPNRKGKEDWTNGSRKSEARCLAEKKTGRHVPRWTDEHQGIWCQHLVQGGFHVDKNSLIIIRMCTELVGRFTHRLLRQCRERVWLQGTRQQAGEDPRGAECPLWEWQCKTQEMRRTNLQRARALQAGEPRSTKPATTHRTRRLHW